MSHWRDTGNKFYGNLLEFDSAHQTTDRKPAKTVFVAAIAKYTVHNTVDVYAILHAKGEFPWPTAKISGQRVIQSGLL